MAARKFGLGVRLAFAMVFSMTVLLAVMGALNLRQNRISQEALIRLSEDRLGELILRSTHRAMLHNDREELASMLRDIGGMTQLERVRIYDKAGTIRYSSRPEEVGRTVDMTADACDRCHRSGQPLTQLSRRDRVRIYEVDGSRVLATIRAVANEPACSGGACHAHSPDRAVLGVLDVQMSLAGIDAAMRSRTRSLVAVSIAFLALVSFLSVFWAWRTVHRPLGQLVQATRAVSSGDLDQTIPDRAESDLSELVRSFNQMTRDLKEARHESEQWSRSLERRVEEKSAALRRAQDEMVQVEKMVSLGKLAAIVAHEINNPLAGIRTYARLMLKRMGSEPSTERLAPQETHDWVSRIESEAARCGDIVRNLLSFARNSAPRIEVTRLQEVVTQSLRLVQHQMDLASVVVETDLDPAVEVECDPQQIKQALLAIFINAAEAMPQGGSLRVEMSPLTAEEWLATRAAGGEASADERAEATGETMAAAAGGVEIRVRDTGIGMDAETARHVFEPFFTTKDGTASGGSGLGLAVVYGIIRSHQGRVRVESAPGQGSVFFLQLPARQDDPQRPAAEELPAT